MTLHEDARRQRCGSVALLSIVALLGCSSAPEPQAGPDTPEIDPKPNKIADPRETVTFSLALRPGTKTRYSVSTEAMTAVGPRDYGAGEDASAGAPPKVFEACEVVFTQEVLGPVPDDVNAVVALVTIEEVRYSRTSAGQPDLAFDSGGSVDQESPFAGLIGKAYTIEINRLGYVTGVFNLRPVRTAVRGSTPAHQAALKLVSPPAIFARHGYFTVPGPDVGPVAQGGRWRGVRQFTLDAPGIDFGALRIHRFEKLYRLERVERRTAGAFAIVRFTASPMPRRTAAGRIEVPYLSWSYTGRAGFDLEAGWVRAYREHLEVQIPLASPAVSARATPDGPSLIATRTLNVRRLQAN
jgi:hypothetical protein